MVPTTERRDDIRRLIEASQNEFVKLLVNTAPMCFFVVDYDRRMVYANDFFKEKLGEADDERIAGRKCYVLCGRESVCPRCALDGAMETMTEQSLFRDDTQKLDMRYSDCHIIPIAPDQRDQELLFLEIIFDITQEVDLEHRLEQDFDRTLDMLLFVMKLQETDIYQHGERVCNLAVAIGQEMGLSQESLSALRIASLLHGIGGIAFIKEGQEESGGAAVDDAVLAVASHNILSQMGRFEDTARIIRAQWENYDGSGLPDGLSGNEIPIESAILRVANVASRAAGEEEAAERIDSGRGGEYRPDVADALLKVLKK